MSKIAHWFSRVCQSVHTYTQRDENRNVALLMFWLIIQTSAFTLVTPYFFTLKNFLNLCKQTAELGMIMVPLAMVLLSGNIDLSMGSVMGVCAISLAKLLKAEVPMLVSIPIVIVLGGLLGSLNGMFVAKLHLAGIVATIGTQVMLRGVCYILTGGRPVSGLPSEFLDIAKWKVFGIPATFVIMLVFFAAAIFIMKRTKFGMKLHSVGYNSRTSIYSGINADRIKMWLYVFSGAVGAIAATFMLTRFASAESAFGTGYDTEVLTSMLVGGMSIAGGSGNLIGALLGLFTISMLRNGMTHMEISSLYQQMVLGVLILISAAKLKCRPKKEKNTKKLIV